MKMISTQRAYKFYCIYKPFSVQNGFTMRMLSKLTIYNSTEMHDISINIIYLSNSVSLEESLKPLANGLLSILSFVIYTYNTTL